MSTDRQQEWDEAYARKNNFLFYPHEEIVRFFARHIRRRVGISEFVDVAADLDNSALLDFGCGIGRHVVFASEMGIDAHGVDLSAAAVAVAREWCVKRGLVDAESRLLQGSGGELPWPDQHFRFALAHGVLDSMPKALARECVLELARVMQPGGLFYCDLVAGEEAGQGDDFAGEVEVATEHERGTIQSYFNNAAIAALFADEFAVMDQRILRCDDLTSGQHFARHHLVLRRVADSGSGER